MLAFLGGPEALGARKVRLFACACCRRIGHLLEDERSRRAIEVAERRAEGTVGRRELAAARRAARAAAVDAARPDERGRLARAAVRLARRAAEWALSDRPGRAVHWLTAQAVGLAHAASEEGVAAARLRSGWQACLGVLPAELRPAAWQALAVPAWQAVAAEQARTRLARAAGRAAEEQGQAELLRDLIGDAFRPAPRLNPAWLDRNGGAVRRLAQAIHDRRRFADLPVLADALEEAGCDDAALLAHCRDGSDHVLGCWALDLLLGKE
jgi:hypothetical protein